MAKKIIKEIIIMLLISIAILLILGIIFYDYLPNNKIIPKTKKYEKSAEIQTALTEAKTEENSKVVVTYEITDTDLNMYKKTSEYVPGKTNPFEDYVETTKQTQDDTSTDSNSNTNNNNSNTNSNSSTNNNANSGKNTTLK